MIKQLLFSFLLLGSLNALAMDATSAVAQPAGAAAPLEVSPDELEALTNLYLAIESYIMEGKSSRLASIQDRIPQVDFQLPYAFRGYDSPNASLYGQVSELIALLTKNGLRKADDKKRFADVEGRLVRAYGIRGLLDLQIDAQRDRSQGRLDNPVESDKTGAVGPADASAEPQKKDPKPLPPTAGTWSLGYRHLLGGLGIVAVVVTVIQYQRSKDRK